MFVRDKILFELNRTGSILIVSALKNIFERLFSEVGIIGLSYYRFLQFAGVIRQCEFRILDIFKHLTNRSRSFYELPEVTAVLITQSNSTAFRVCSHNF